jgi:hypothetical protein
MRAEWDTSAENLVPRVCAKCGKVFTPAPYHQFVTYPSGVQNTRKKYYCKWSCYNHRNDIPDKRGAKAKKVLMYDHSENLLGEFDNAQQAALKLSEAGMNAEGRQIQRACRGELRHYHGFIFKYKE